MTHAAQDEPCADHTNYNTGEPCDCGESTVASLSDAKRKRVEDASEAAEWNADTLLENLVNTYDACFDPDAQYSHQALSDALDNARAYLGHEMSGP